MTCDHRTRITRKGGITRCWTCGVDLGRAIDAVRSLDEFTSSPDPRTTSTGRASARGDGTDTRTKVGGDEDGEG